MCALDARRRQELVVYGGKNPFTTVVEVDESRFGKWKVEDNGVVTHFHYVLQGCVTRGDMTSLAIWEYGVTKSEGVGRVPPVEVDRWVAKAHNLFNEKSAVVLMSDGAPCYKHLVPGIAEHHSVNHSEREWTRPEMVLVNVETQVVCRRRRGSTHCGPIRP